MTQSLDSSLSSPWRLQELHLREGSDDIVVVAHSKGQLVSPSVVDLVTLSKDLVTRFRLLSSARSL